MTRRTFSGTSGRSERMLLTKLVELTSNLSRPSVVCSSTYLVVQKRRVLNFGAARGELRVRRSGTSPRRQQVGRWGAVPKQGGAHFRPAVGQALDAEVAVH